MAGVIYPVLVSSPCCALRTSNWGRVIHMWALKMGWMKKAFRISLHVLHYEPPTRQSLGNHFAGL